MRKDLLKRIEALEATIGTSVVTLHMPDGSRHTISSKVKHMFRLYAAGMARSREARADAPEPVSPLARELDWIRDAVRIDESGHLFELLSVILQGAVDSEGNTVDTD